eukprot:895563-Rhodomonas_salina.2
MDTCVLPPTEDGTTQPPIVLRVCYAMPGTDIACVVGPMTLYYVLSGRVVCEPVPPYALATPCPVLTARAVCTRENSGR